MLRFIIRRILITIPTILIVITIAWGLIKLAPGNFYSGEKRLPPAIEKLTALFAGVKGRGDKKLADLRHFLAVLNSIGKRSPPWSGATTAPSITSCSVNSESPSPPKT